MSDVYVVLGMHRSGTSLVSSMLHVGGIEMCRHSCGQGSRGQPYGHFEDSEFKALNNLILYKAGGDWKTPPSPDDISEGVRVFHRAMDMQIRARAVNRPAWGWKDPRTSLTAEQWHKLLVITGHHTYYIFTERSKAEVIKSLLKRSRGEWAEWDKLYDIYNERLSAFKKLLIAGGIPFINISFYRLVYSHPETEANALAKFAGCVDEVDKMMAQIRQRTAEGE